MEKRVGVAVDFSSCSKEALRWAVENVVRDGDHLILVVVRPEAVWDHASRNRDPELVTVDSGRGIYLDLFFEDSYIPLDEFSDPLVMKKYGVKPDPETLDILNCVAREKAIVVVTKIYWGDPREKICEAIDKIPLSCLIIGNRGLGRIKRALLGSVSNHVVNNGTCPVTVVKNGNQHEG
ncbi:hypothetical protein GIB67_019491 [Kingdonia uniflora]|uniref:UspA domain-containing protein n=1 Tax=Kingdonia uniflora TaxID=39325 RepID=A0A7J7N029_9MAGN|nr:hypothetical protein GIB67_019491 [Kingdonia uniflora]